MTVSPLTGLTTSNNLNFSARRPSPQNLTHQQSRLIETLVNGVYFQAEQEAASAGLSTADGHRSLNASELARLRESLGSLFDLSSRVRTNELNAIKRSLNDGGIRVARNTSAQDLHAQLQAIYGSNRALPEHYWRYQADPYKLLGLDLHANPTVRQINAAVRQLRDRQDAVIAGLTAGTPQYREAQRLRHQVIEAGRFLRDPSVRPDYDGRLVSQSNSRAYNLPWYRRARYIAPAAAVAIAVPAALVAGPLTLATGMCTAGAAGLSFATQRVVRGVARHNGFVNYARQSLAAKPAQFQAVLAHPRTQAGLVRSRNAWNWVRTTIFRRP